MDRHAGLDSPLVFAVRATSDVRFVRADIHGQASKIYSVVPCVLLDTASLLALRRLCTGGLPLEVAVD